MIEFFNSEDVYRIITACCAAITISHSLVYILTDNTKDAKFKGFNIARKILGTTLFLWSIYLICNLMFNLRFTNDYAAMSVNLATYLLLIEGFEMTFHTLLDRKYFSWHRMRRAILICLLFNASLALNYLNSPKFVQPITIIGLSIPLITKISLATFRTYKRYQEVRINVENYYSDNISDGVVWMKKSIFIMTVLGFSSIFIVYGSAATDSITLIIAMGILIYFMVSFNNFIIAIENINLAIIHTPTTPHHSKASARPIMIKNSIDKWVAEHKFTKMGITIETVANDINSNRTYLSDYINSAHGYTFRNWIAKLRIEYSLSIMIKHPELHIVQIADKVGYSRSSFISAFTKEVGMTPTKWREEQKLIETK